MIDGSDVATCVAVNEPLVNSARYLPWMKLSVFKKISLNLDSPIGLYFKLNLSNRWKVSWCACMSRVSIERSYALRPSDSNTSARVRYFSSRKMTTSYRAVSMRVQIWRKTDIRGALHFWLDESQQVFLVHTARMMNVGIDLAGVVKIPRNELL